MSAGTFAAAVMVGSMIDNLFIMPTLFPADPVDGGRMGEFGIMGAAEGDPISMIFGEYARVPGQVVWISDDLQEVSHSERDGKNSRRKTRSYYVDAIVIVSYLGETWSPGTIDRIDQVFMDQKRVFANADTTPPDTTAEDGLFVVDQGGWYFVAFDTAVNANCVANFYDKWLVGDRISWSGWLNAANNDSSDLILEKTQRGFPDSSPAGFRMLNVFKMQKGKVNEFAGSYAGNDIGAVPGRTITATGVSGSGWADGLFRGAISTLRDGSHASSWSTYRDEVGDVNAPGWLDCAWLPLNALNLGDFGNRFPNVEFIASADSSLRTPRAIIGHLLEQAKLDSTEYDTTEVDNATTVLGMVIRGPVEAAKALQPLMLANDIIAQERGKKLYFFDRADNVSNTYEVDAELVVNTDQDGSGIDVQETPTDQRYGEVTVTFVDYDDENYRRGLARAVYLSEGTVVERESPERWTKLAVNLDMTLTQGDAKEIAYRLLAHSQADVLKFSFTLPPRYLYLQENDRIQFTSDGVTYSALISRIDVGANFDLRIEATLDVAVEQDYSTWNV